MPPVSSPDSGEHSPLILEHSPLGHLLLTTRPRQVDEWYIAYANPAAAGLMGLPTDTLIGTSLSALNSPLVGYLERLLPTLQAGQIRVTDYCQVSQGSWLRLRLVPLEPGWLLTLEEVTALKEQTQLLQRLINDALLPIALLQAQRDETGQVVDFRYVLTNWANARYLGLSPQQMVGQRWGELFPDIYLTGLYQKALQTLETGQTQRLSLAGESGGKSQWLDIQLSAHGDAVLLTFMDVTELRQAVLQAQQARAEMEQALERERELSGLKTRFVGLVSHELRTPLAIIQSGVELIQMQVQRLLPSNGPSELGEQVRDIQQAIRRINHLTYQVQALGGQVGPRFTGQAEPLELVTWGKQLVERWERQLEAPGRLRFQAPEAGLWVLTHEQLLEQALTQLVRNALLYGKGDEQPVVIALEEQPAHLLLTITDEGMGIPSREQASVFEAFYRASNVGNRPGIGLGLTLAKEYIEGLGGQLSLQSVEQQYTRVRVSLPRFLP